MLLLNAMLIFDTREYKTHETEYWVDFLYNWILQKNNILEHIWLTNWED